MPLLHLQMTVNRFTPTQEWRHAHGMRCLGIPNTAHFANVTLIEDAVACNVNLFVILNMRAGLRVYVPKLIYAERRH